MDISECRTMPFSHSIRSHKNTPTVPANITDVAIIPILLGPYFGTRKPNRGMTEFIREIELSNDAKSVLDACSCSESLPFNGPTR